MFGLVMNKLGFDLTPFKSWILPFGLHFVIAFFFFVSFLQPLITFVFLISLLSFDLFDIFFSSSSVL